MSSARHVSDEQRSCGVCVHDQTSNCLVRVCEAAHTSDHVAAKPFDVRRLEISKEAH